VFDRTNGDTGSAIPGHYGAEAAGLTLCEATLTAAWNVQGNPTRTPFVTRVQQLFDVPLPLIPNTTKRGNALIVLWLGPRSWLLVESSSLRRPSTLTDFGPKRDVLNALGGALFDVSASRVAYRIRGTHAATVLAKSCPLDFHQDAFPAGGCAQSVFGHVNAFFFQQDAAPTFLMLVARSFARDVWRLLCRSSAQYGYDVVASQPVADSS
jgi:heterotetrameric sarcosine oxidase gamma subunit